MKTVIAFAWSDVRALSKYRWRALWARQRPSEGSQWNKPRSSGVLLQSCRACQSSNPPPEGCNDSSIFPTSRQHLVFIFKVPELTRSISIQLNERAPLRERARTRYLWDVASYLDLRSASIWRSHFVLAICYQEAKMTGIKASRNERAVALRPGFRIVCINCDALGIIFDCEENSPPSTPIRCRHCGAPRGTLGDLRELSTSQRRNLFDV
jgi:hypothetical protein